MRFLSLAALARLDPPLELEVAGVLDCYQGQRYRALFLAG